VIRARAKRELVDVPVTGPAEASVSLAMQFGHRFAIVTIFDNGASWTEPQVRAMGVESRLAAAVGVAIPVLEMEQDRP
jgi:Asp/Glu/hydantoin racemase